MKDNVQPVQKIGEIRGQIHIHLHLIFIDGVY